jgi:predicted HNH restriction endonuclease
MNKNFTSVEEVENENKKDKSNAASGGVWQWMRKNIFSSQGHVMWLTPLNIINIVKIYKDAIVQNYQSNQKVKENAFAKKINLYKPIDHTLKKLARSSNHTETSEFKEYIEREGYTFDDVFGPDGKVNML